MNRAASVIPRHDGRVIWMTYTPDGPVEQTLLLVGKGVTYDTGGADIKAGGKISGRSKTMDFWTPLPQIKVSDSSP